MGDGPGRSSLAAEQAYCRKMEEAVGAMVVPASWPMGIQSCVDRSGRVLDSWHGMILQADVRYRTVRLHQIGPFRISTVWLQFNHNFHQSGRPVTFETMIFSDYTPPEEAGDWSGGGECARWSSEEEAWAGHGRMVRKYTALAREVIAGRKERLLPWLGHEDQEIRRWAIGEAARLSRRSRS